jgi:hypothetical protein
MAQLTPYSTFTSGLDWHFKRRHHLLVIVYPNQTTHTAALNHTITFKNVTFQTGSSPAHCKRILLPPGYRYDIIHRPRGHLGIVAQFNLLDIKATLTGVAIQSSTQTTTSTASGSVFAPLPVFGPEGRAYFARKSLVYRCTFEGNVLFWIREFHLHCRNSRGDLDPSHRLYWRLSDGEPSRG